MGRQGVPLMKELKKVYLLRHTYEFGSESEFECTKELGIYTTRKHAEAAINFYRTLPGFCNYPKRCFIIESYILDRNSWWTEGFISWEDA